MLGNAKGVAEGIAVRERILRTELHLAKIAFIDTIPYTGRNLPNLRCLLLADRQVKVPVANARGVATVVA